MLETAMMGRGSDGTEPRKRNVEEVMDRVAAMEAEVGLEERVTSFGKKVKKQAQDSIYAKDELSKKILRHLTTFDRKGIRKLTPKSVRKMKSRQLDYVRRYFAMEYGIQEEIMKEV